MYKHIPTDKNKHICIHTFIRIYKGIYKHWYAPPHSHTVPFQTRLAEHWEATELVPIVQNRKAGETPSKAGLSPAILLSNKQLLWFLSKFQLLPQHPGYINLKYGFPFRRLTSPSPHSPASKISATLGPIPEHTRPS